MALPQKAKLPMALSVGMGICMLAADGYVINDLLRQRADRVQVTLASLFAVLVFAIWLRGYYCAWGYLAGYLREEEALEGVGENLQALAEDVKNHVKEGKWAAPVFSFPNAPLLNRRVKHIWAALQRGAPLLGSDMTESEDRHFPGSERELRTYMDIALNVGIAGTFVSILITLGQPEGLTAEKLLAHIGPGMVSGLAAIIANIGLRFCHRALQDEQDALAEQVDKTVLERFVFELPKVITSPEERLAVAATNLADRAIEKLEAQNAATQKALSDQAGRFDALLKEYARQIGAVLTQQVQHPVQQIAEHAQTLATHTGALAQHSGTSAATAANLKTAHVAFLDTQKQAQEQHEKRVAELYAQFCAGLDAFLQAAGQAHNARIQETQEFTRSLLTMHGQSLIGMAEHLRNQFVNLQVEQEAAHRRVTESALAALGDAVTTRLTAIEERASALLIALESRLPSAVREGVHDALSETTALLDTLREQTAGLAHAISQISQSADRHLQAYEQWHGRAMEVQGQIERVRSDRTVCARRATGSLADRCGADAGQHSRCLRSNGARSKIRFYRPDGRA